MFISSILLNFSNALFVFPHLQYPLIIVLYVTASGLTNPASITSKTCSADSINIELTSPLIKKLNVNKLGSISCSFISFHTHNNSSTIPRFPNDFINKFAHFMLITNPLFLTSLNTHLTLSTSLEPDKTSINKA
ncbi:hypothetical protein HanRHA438_Chr17g0822791 [Helianthus annuus]|nr:hypothetical protein HanRHA438_Chr17g0822791 [Helianthus annuus]